MLNFESLPKDKPSQNNIVEGTYKATVFKTEMRVSKETGNEFLNVSFKIDNGGFVNENYFDSDKPFLMYKLGRLLKACNVELKGKGSLKDVAKVIKGKKVIIDVVVNDRGYGALDYSGDKEGIYPATENHAMNEEVSQAIEASTIDMSDEDF